MEDQRDHPTPTLDELRRVLDESEADIAAGRMAPVESVLSELRERADRLQERQEAIKTAS